MGCPHPNEPIGALTVEALVRLLAAEPALDALDYTWTLLPCVDPDGTRLNEGWFGAPGVLSRYARGFYRPPMSCQVEWTFPCRCNDLVFDSPLPETRAIMDLIDELRPVYLYSLHNSGFGGIYYYLSEPAPGLYPDLTAITAAAGLAAHLGEPEVPYASPLAPSIYLLPAVRQAYEFLKAQGVDPRAVISGGASSADYAAARAGSFTLVTEVPYLTDERMDDETPTAGSRRDSVRQQLAALSALHRSIRQALDQVGPDLAPSPFLEAVADLARRMPAQMAALEHWVAHDPSMDRPATVAEAFDSQTVARFYAALNLGMLARALDSPADGADLERVEEHRRRVAALLQEWCSLITRDSRCQAIPIRKLVAVQLAAGLTTARYLLDRVRQ